MTQSSYAIAMCESALLDEVYKEADPPKRISNVVMFGIT